MLDPRKALERGDEPVTKSNQALQEIRSHFHHGESLVYWLPATWTHGGDASGTISGVLAVTDARVVFHGGLLWQKKDHSMPLSTITSIDLERGLLGHITVLAAAGSMRYLVNRRASQQWVAAANQQLDTSRRRPGMEAGRGPVVSTADELAKLAALRTSGVLTDSEFAAAKLQLLRS